jgi:hypothetical protein
MTIEGCFIMQASCILKVLGHLKKHQNKNLTKQQNRYPKRLFFVILTLRKDLNLPLKEVARKVQAFLMAAPTN